MFQRYTQVLEEVTMEWRHITVDGMQWEVRAISSELPGGRQEGEELLEFRSKQATMPPRRVTVRQGALETISDADLKSAFVQARPIGGDHYGRPGKRMPDVT
jgi:hypothetical protein